MSKAKKVAEEIVGVLKYNPQLTDAEKILSVETKLDRLIQDVEDGIEQARKRTQGEALLMEAPPGDREALLNSQQFRGPLN